MVRLTSIVANVHTRPDAQESSLSADAVHDFAFDMVGEAAVELPNAVAQVADVITF